MNKEGPRCPLGDLVCADCQSLSFKFSLKVSQHFHKTVKVIVSYLPSDLQCVHEVLIILNSKAVL